MKDSAQSIHEFLNTLTHETTPSVSLSGLRGSSVALVIARTAASGRGPIFCITATEQQAAYLEQDLGLFTDLPVFLFPAYDIPPYTPLSPDPATVATRVSTLYQVVTCDTPFILVAPVEAVLRRTLPKDPLTSKAELVIQNEDTDQKELVNRLVAAGYTSVSLVQNTGEFSVRGGILDIFSPGFDHPLRLDFFGDTVESIRHFDPISQRSVADMGEAVILPACDILFPSLQSSDFAEILAKFRKNASKFAWDRTETNTILARIENQSRFSGIEFLLPIIYKNPSTVLDYLAPNTTAFLVDSQEIKRSSQLTWERITANHQEALDMAKPALPPESLFLSEDELYDKLASLQLIRVNDFSESIMYADQDSNKNVSPSTAAHGLLSLTIRGGNHKLLKQGLELERKRQGMLTPLVRIIEKWLDHGEYVFFSCRSGRHAGNLADLLNQHNLPIVIQEPPLKTPADQKEVVLYTHPVSEGFDLPSEKLHILSESELFGEKRLKKVRKTRKRDREGLASFEELNLGDITVHHDHGLGTYQGLVHMEIGGISNDFLKIEYLEADKLYVPVDRINTISKYKGISDRKPKLDRLGSKTWANTKNKVTKAVWKVAFDLLNLYAKRELAQGTNFSVPDELYHELEESFPFDETPGQIKAINEVVSDLTSEKPMDRLICGDVGFGKTEVALRAAFKVIEDSYQVAVLVPTTVLAEQHAATFKERLQGLPVTIKSLNRFRSQSEQRQILKDLATGKVDIIIGTHRLLSKDVIFKKLGLLVIDEEHRFGVTHKEKLKKLRSQVDVLTLTATPIPRTLQLSLLGIRDLSVISSPPEHRRSIKTFVARHDDLVIKEAVVRELQRGGQIFLVHNRVRSIHEMAANVQRLVPEAKISVAHGQMPGKDLEEIMVRFVNKEIDVLVCTTIIESGLDIPNANTIVITRADRLGLAEIYQLRGRVGRSSEQAYAYLLVPSLDGMSRDAQQRLRALLDYNELGGGFKLAMSDLQIRGGGNILGESQSGNIAAVGYDLYLDLLQKTVEDLKRKAAAGIESIGEAEDIEPEINLNISAYIPEHYISHTDQRYIAYRRITSINSSEELLDLQNEMKDRYGPPPHETLNLFQVVELKIALKDLKIVKLEQGPTTLVFTFHEKTSVGPEKILALVKKSPNIRFTPDSKLIVQNKNTTSQSTFNVVYDVMHQIT